ncbi:MAG: hypothetical protein HYW25_01005 [Candidatus Aenigmarchaeota archaeon]|nr:hypothetical protein [Candidatus Aenigmarchaeota archaeon]
MVDLPIDITGLFPAGVGIAPVALIIGFIAFILVFKTILGFLKNILIVAVASAAFPFVLVYIGYSMPITFSSITGFVILGILLYAALSVFKFAARIAGKK